MFTYGLLAALRNVTIGLLLAVPAAVPAQATTIAALGDSLTQGYGLAPEDGFVPQLQAWLATQGQTVTVQNAGVSGDTSAGGLARLDWTLVPEVQALIVTLGGNDMLRGIDPAQTRANIDALLKATTARNIPVLLIAMQAPGNYGPDYKTRFDALYPDLAAQYHVLLAPGFFAPLLAANPDPAAMAKYLQPDGLHPSPEGVKKIVAGIGPLVLDLLKEIK